jgi:hypothetical protein
MRDAKGTVSVHTSKAPPQMFKEGQGRRGRRQTDARGTFEANN